MKKKFLMFLACFCLIVPACLFMTACGDDPVNYNVKVEAKSGGTDYLIMNNGMGLNSYAFQVESGENFSTNLMLAGNYDPDTLKIYNGETEVAWTKDPNLNANDTFGEEFVKVGTLSLSNVQGDMNLKYEAQEKQISFTIKRAGTDTNELTSDQVTMLQSFKLASDTSKNLYDLVTANEGAGYTFTTTYSQRKNPIYFVCDKKVGYYDTYSLNSAFEPKISATKNTYSLTLTNNSFVYMSNELEFDLSSIRVNQLSVFLDDSDFNVKNIFDISGKLDSFDAGQSNPVTFTLKDVEGVDFSNIKFYINGSLVNHDFSSNKTFTLNNLANMPIDYNNDELSFYSNLTNYNIKVDGIQITDASEFCTADLSKENDGLIYQKENLLYADKTNNIAYYTGEIFFEYYYNNAQTLTITLGENTCTVTAAEISEHLSESSLDWLNSKFTTNEGLVTGITTAGEGYQINIKFVKGAKYIISAE